MASRIFHDSRNLQVANGRKLPIDRGTSSAWISQAEAARLRRVSRQAIFDLKTKNRFRVLKVGSKALLNREDVETYQRKRGQPLPGIRDSAT